MLVSIYVTLHLASIEQAWKLLIVTGAGTGTVLLLRWFWWRINAWSEVSAMVSSFVVALGFFIAGKMGLVVPSHISLIITVAVTTVVWLVATYVATPTDRATLVSFYRLVRPAGPGWNSVRAEAGVPASPDSLANAFIGWILGCLFVYAALFGTGSFLYGRQNVGLTWLVVFVLSGLGLIKVLRDSARSAATAD
jgi:solute:Na+ symporter, SSS family